MTINTQILYGVRNFKDREGQDKAQWTRIGTAFECKDGSWNLVLDYIPSQMGATINMRPPKAEEPKDEA